MKNSIEYYTNKINKEKEKETRKVFDQKITPNEALDKLVSINPQIIKDNPLLEREYNLDGTKKEEIIPKR